LVVGGWWLVGGGWSVVVGRWWLVGGGWWQIGWGVKIVLVLDFDERVGWFENGSPR
jgi:hypothetical protein